MNRLDKKKTDYSLLGFLIPFAGMCLVILISTLVLSKVYPTRVYSMLRSDCYHQYYPFFKAFRQALLSGDSLLYSWDVGMGMDYLGLISYYLGSPLNLLSVLVPESLLLSYFTYMTALRVGFAGLFFAIFLKKVFGKNDLSIALFGSLYGLCAWALGYGWNVMWMDTFTLLPLVVLGTVELLSHRKFLLYTVSLFFSIVINYYIGFFTCIFTLLVFICYEICRFRSLKKFFADLGLMALFTVLAIGMTAVMSLPTLAALNTTYSSVNEFPAGFTFNKNLAKSNAFWDVLDGMRKVATNSSGAVELTYLYNEGYPNVYCGVIANVLAVLYLTCKQIKIRDRICALVMLAFINFSFVNNQLDYIWHGFHETNMIPYRFSFLYSFVLLYMAYKAYTLRRRIRPWQILTALGVALGLVLLSDNFKEAVEALSDPQWGSNVAANWNGNSTKLAELMEPLVFVLFNGIFLAFYGLVLLWGAAGRCRKGNHTWAQRRENHRALRSRQAMASVFLLCFIGAELCMNLTYFGVDNFPGINVSNYPNGQENTASVIRVMKQREEDNLFYRAEMTRTQTLNDGALNGYHGISTFTSSANVSVTRFMQNLGYAAMGNWNRYVFEESSPVANLFLNLKYMIDRDGTVASNPYFQDINYMGSTHLLENQYYLPLGFLADSALGELSFQNANTNKLLFQNELLSAAVGHLVTPWVLVENENLFISASDNVTLNSTTGQGYASYTTGASQGSVYYTYHFQNAGFFCIDLNMPKKNNFTVSYAPAGGEYTTVYSEDYKLPYTLQVCQVNPGDRVQITVKCAANESGTTTIRGGLLDEMIMYHSYQTLSQSTLELTAFQNTYIEGTIDCHKDGLLYTSIPQDGNWHAYVDGVEVDTVSVGNAMVGVPITQGPHTVTFRYINKAFITGCVASLVCAAALGGICCLQYYQKKKPGKFSK